MEKEFMKKKIYFVQALSNIHCGIGQGVEDIDLPTAKESTTGFPFIPGSTIKGVLRDYHSRNSSTEIIKKAAFGPDFTQSEDDPHASALMISDAGILLMPVRSFAGVFSYVTCPLILHRFASDLSHAGGKAPAEIPSTDNNRAIVTKNSVNLVDGNLLLEDLDMSADNNKEWETWSESLRNLIFEKQWADNVVQKRMSLIPDDIFSFLCLTSLPVSARIKMDKKKGTVQKGGLWYEESLPSESILSGIIGATDSYTKKRISALEILKEYATNPLTLQLGGMATNGKGLCTIRYSGQGEE